LYKGKLGMRKLNNKTNYEFLRLNDTHPAAQMHDSKITISFKQMSITPYY